MAMKTARSTATVPTTTPAAQGPTAFSVFEGLALAGVTPGMIAEFCGAEKALVEDWRTGRAPAPLGRVVFLTMVLSHLVDDLVRTYEKCSLYTFPYGTVLCDESERASVLIVPKSEVRPKFYRLIRSGMINSVFYLGPREVLKLELHETFMGARILEVIGNSHSEYIWSLGTTKAAKGQGLGRAIMEACDRYAVEKGLEGLALKTENPGNVSFYKKFGYEVKWEGTSALAKIPSWVLFKRFGP